METWSNKSGSCRDESIVGESMKILEYADEKLLPASEKARWQAEFDKLYDEALQSLSALPNMNFTNEEIHYLSVLRSPKLWAAETLKWFCRDYQEIMLSEMASSKRTVLRLGRRLGKTETMCVIILWHAFTQPNKGPNNQYDILIIAPYEEQVDLIFKRLKQLIDMSPEMQSSVTRDIHHHIEFNNGTVIHGLTAGSKSGTGAANTRGQRADLIVLDESDYLTENDITNIMNIRNEAPERIKMIVASTPSGKRESYYKWCTGATVSYGYDDEQTKASSRVMYKRSIKPWKQNVDGTFELNEAGNKMREGNGWTTIHAPSTVNPELLKVNPDTGLTYIEELRLDLTEMRFIQEVMAEFGESISGVFLKKHIDAAVDLGRKLRVEYRTKDFDRNGPRILGVDWDKRKADTNMVGMEWNYEEKRFIPFFRKAIPRGDFTYDQAVEAIKKADETFNFDYILADAGHGEFQIETLRKYYKMNPRLGSPKKIVRINLSEKVTVYDPITRKPEKKDIKPFMVNNAVLMFERGLVALNPRDKETITQFEAYEVKSWSQNGRPTYTDENEHILDCIVFCIFGFTKFFDDILKITKATAIHIIRKPILEREDNVQQRGISAPESVDDKRIRKLAATLGIQPNPGRKKPTSSGRRSMGMPSRKGF